MSHFILKCADSVNPRLGSGYSDVLSTFLSDKAIEELPIERMMSLSNAKDTSSAHLQLFVCALQRFLRCGWMIDAEHCVSCVRRFLDWNGNPEKQELELERWWEDATLSALREQLRSRIAQVEELAENATTSSPTSAVCVRYLLLSLHNMLLLAESLDSAKHCGEGPNPRLGRSISALEESLEHVPPGDPLRFAALILLAVSHWHIALSRVILSSGPDATLTRSEVGELKRGIWRYDEAMKEDAEGNEMHERAAKMIDGDESESGAGTDAGEICDEPLEQDEDDDVGEWEDVDDENLDRAEGPSLTAALELLRKVASTHRRAPHPLRSDTLALLLRGLVALDESDEQKGTALLDEAIDVGREALQLRPAPHPGRRWVLYDLGVVLGSRFDSKRAHEDLYEAHRCFSELLTYEPGVPPPADSDSALHPSSTAGTGVDDEADDPYQEAKDDRSHILSYLTHLQFECYEISGTPEDLEKAIGYAEEAVALREAPHPDRALSLTDLGTCLGAKLELGTPSLEDVDKVIAIHREACTLVDEEDPGTPSDAKGRALNGLAFGFFLRFGCTGKKDDILSAIGYARDGLSMGGTWKRRTRSATTLGKALLAGLKAGCLDPTNGDSSDTPKSPLTEVTDLFQECLRLTPPSDTIGRATALENMTAALEYRYDCLGDIKDLNDALQAGLEALHIRGIGEGSLEDGIVVTGDMATAKYTTNLANALMARARLPRGDRHLDSAIELYMAAVGPSWNSADLASGGDVLGVDEPSAADMGNLAEALRERAGRRLSVRMAGLDDDLDAAISLGRRVLQLRPGSHPERCASVINLSAALMDRARAMLKTSHSKKPEEDAIQSVQEALSILESEALPLVVEHHPLRTRIYHRLSQAYELQFKLLESDEDLDQSFYYIRLAVCDTEAHTEPRGDSLHHRLLSCKLWGTQARRYGRAETEGMAAYTTALGLLPHLGRVELGVAARQRMLTHISGFASSAAQVAIESGRMEDAVVFLTSFSSVFWTQQLRLRSSGVDGLTMDGLGPTQTWESVVAAAKNGPIIFVSPREDGGECFALIVARGEVQYVPLEGIDRPGCLSLLEDLVLLTSPDARKIKGKYGAEWLIVGLSRPEETVFPSGQEEMDGEGVEVGDEGEARGVRPSKSFNRPKTFEHILKVLWTSVVRPCVEALNLAKVDGQVPTTRIWWYPVGVFAFLPLHAAGIYGDSTVPEESIMDYAISSYCSTLHNMGSPPAREQGKTTGENAGGLKSRIVAVIQRDIPGRPSMSLPQTIAELEKIKAHVPHPYDASLEVHLGVSRPLSITRPEDVLASLDVASLVHFGCHGKQDLSNPLESYLLLSGGKLTIKDLISHQDPQQSSGASRGTRSRLRLAYLSACETARVELGRPDQFLHMAASMQFAGFQSVVGTLWAIADADAPVVADAFYGHLLRNINGSSSDAQIGFDVTESASALHRGVLELRKRGRPLKRWVPFIHFGV